MRSALILAALLLPSIAFADGFGRPECEGDSAQKCRNAWYVAADMAKTLPAPFGELKLRGASSEGPVVVVHGEMETPSTLPSGYIDNEKLLRLFDKAKFVSTMVACIRGTKLYDHIKAGGEVKFNYIYPIKVVPENRWVNSDYDYSITRCE